MKTTIKDYLVKYRKKLKVKKNMLSIFLCIEDRIEISNQDILKNLDKVIPYKNTHRLIPGDIIIYNEANKQHYIYLDSITTEGCVFRYLREFKDNKGPAELTDEIKIGKHDIENNNADIETTVGRYMLNSVALVCSEFKKR